MLGRKISLVLIIAGIFTTCLPLGAQAYLACRQKALNGELLQQQKKYDLNNSAEEGYMKLQGTFEKEAAGNSVNHTASGYEDEIATTFEEGKAGLNKQDNGTAGETLASTGSGKSKVLGLLEIKKLKIKAAVLEGADAGNLRIATGHITGTAGIGEPGNTVIAGHRDFIAAHYFRYLDRLQEGDEIILTAKGSIYKYRVYEKFLVQPDDLSVLQSESKERKLTLITCQPFLTSSKRLIVRAKIE